MENNGHLFYEDIQVSLVDTKAFFDNVPLDCLALALKVWILCF